MNVLYSYIIVKKENPYPGVLAYDLILGLFLSDIYTGLFLIN